MSADTPYHCASSTGTVNATPRLTRASGSSVKERRAIDTRAAIKLAAERE